MTVLDEIADAILQGEQTGTTLDQCNGVHAETCLQWCHLEQFIQDNAGIGIALHVHNDTHTFTVALVIGIAYTVQFALLHQFGNVLDKLRLVDTIGYLSDNDLVVLVMCLNIGLGTHDDASASCFVGILYSLQAHDVGTCREVGALHVLHQGLGIHLRIVHVCHTGINNLTQVVGGDVRCHTNGNTGSTVNQQVGDTGRHYGRLLQGIVEVVGHVHRILLQILHHSLAHHAEACFGVTHCRSTVTVYRAKVSLTVNKRIAHVPVLCHAHQCAIHGTIAMGMILTKHLTHYTGTLLVGFVVRVAQSLHTEENTAVNGLETVAHVG